MKPAVGGLGALAQGEMTQPLHCFPHPLVFRDAWPHAGWCTAIGTPGNPVKRA